MGRRGGRHALAQSRRGARGPRTSLAKLEYAVGPDRTRNAFMGAACQVVVLNSLHAVSTLRFWSSDRLQVSMLPLEEILVQATGFAVLFFAPLNNNKALYKTAPGQIWSYITRRVIRTVLQNAKSQIFASPASSVPGSESIGIQSISAVIAAESHEGLDSGSFEILKPPRLDVLGNKDDILKAVKEAADELEIKKGLKAERSNVCVFVDVVDWIGADGAAAFQTRANDANH